MVLSYTTKAQNGRFSRVPYYNNPRTVRDNLLVSSAAAVTDDLVQYKKKKNSRVVLAI